MTAQEHQQRGTHRAARHGDKVNPEPPVGVPQPPKELFGDALAEWGRMLERLEQSRCLTMVDDAVLYQYCQLFAETEALAVSQAEAVAGARVLEENIGDLKGADLVACFQEITKLRKLEFGYSGQIRQGRMGLRTYLIEFGMTPAARSRVKIAAAPKEDDKWAGVLQ